jgi:hypothetical protein
MHACVFPFHRRPYYPRLDGHAGGISTPRRRWRFPFRSLDALPALDCQRRLQRKMIDSAGTALYHYRVYTFRLQVMRLV